jgi:hypothetical protein
VLENTEIKEPKDDDLDLDNDGKISYLTVGTVSLAENIVIEKNKDGEPKLKKDGSYEKAVELVALDAGLDALSVKEENRKSGLFGGTMPYGHLETADGKLVELILVEDDVQAMDVLLKLQELGMNANKLATHFVPVFTVGADADYKAYVLKALPSDKAERKEYLLSMALVADMTALKDEEWKNREAGEKNQVDDMVFNTLNQIDAGRLSGTAMDDYDAIAAAAAKLLAKLVKGKTIDKAIEAIPYTVYPE